MVICRSFASLTFTPPPNLCCGVAGCLPATTTLRHCVVPGPCPVLEPWQSKCECLAVAPNGPQLRDGGGHSLHSTTRRLLLVTPFLLGATHFAEAKQVPMMEEPDAPKFRRTATGVKIQDVLEGTGPEVNEGDLVEFNYVLRRANGYYVFSGMDGSTIDLFSGSSEPVVFPLGKGKIIPGLEEVLLGMKPGGKRRALVPPDVGYTDLNLEPQPQDFGPRRSLLSHIKEPLVFEVQLLRIK